jgi:hypothetical protein
MIAAFAAAVAAVQHAKMLQKLLTAEIVVTR